MIRGIKFAGIPVRDQDAALKFYTEKLGFKVVTDQPFTDDQRWIEIMIPGAETGWRCSLRRGTRNALGIFSRYRSGATMYSRRQRR